MRLLVHEGVKGDGGDIRRADERDLAVRARGIDLALVLDRDAVLRLEEVLYSLPLFPSARTKMLTTSPRVCGRGRVGAWKGMRRRRTHKPSRPQNAILQPHLLQMRPHLPHVNPAFLRQTPTQQHEPLDAMLLDRQVDESRHARYRIRHRRRDEVDGRYPAPFGNDGGVLKWVREGGGVEPVEICRWRSGRSVGRGRARGEEVGDAGGVEEGG